MRTVTIVIADGSDAFQDGNAEHELARILRDLAKKIESGTIDDDTEIFDYPIKDINGNTIGQLSVDVDDEDE